MFSPQNNLQLLSRPPLLPIVVVEAETCLMVHFPNRQKLMLYFRRYFQCWSIKRYTCRRSSSLSTRSCQGSCVEVFDKGLWRNLRVWFPSNWYQNGVQEVIIKVKQAAFPFTNFYFRVQLFFGNKSQQIITNFSSSMQSTAELEISEKQPVPGQVNPGEQIVQIFNVQCNKVVFLNLLVLIWF